MGAGWATLLAYVTAYMIMYKMSQSVTPMSIGFGKATAWAIVWTFVAAASMVAPGNLKSILGLGVIVMSVAAALAALASAAPVLARPVPPLGAMQLPVPPLPDMEVL